MMRRVGTFIWTACAAGWAVIGYTLDHMPALLVCLGCLCMAALWNEVMPEGVTPQKEDTE